MYKFVCLNFTRSHAFICGPLTQVRLIAWGAVLLPHQIGRDREAGRRRRPAVGPPAAVARSAADRAMGRPRLKCATRPGAHLRTMLTAATTARFQGCSPTIYYTVRVKHEEWASGLRWDWDPRTQVVRTAAATNEFRTLPDQTKPLGGVHLRRARRLRRHSSPVQRPGSSASGRGPPARSLTENVRLILTTSDNIYAAQLFTLDEGFRAER